MLIDDIERAVQHVDDALAERIHLRVEFEHGDVTGVPDGRVVGVRELRVIRVATRVTDELQREHIPLDRHRLVPRSPTLRIAVE